nr:succinate dehydrogenase assembly factor 2 [Oceanicoccus sp. KOV_DT_Chl]
MIDENDYKRIRWASRRGMLELDLILVPFVENQFRGLNDQDKRRYINLLEGEDNDLFVWCLGRQVPTDPDDAAIIKLIIEYARSANKI